MLLTGRYLFDQLKRADFLDFPSGAVSCPVLAERVEMTVKEESKNGKSSSLTDRFSKHAACRWSKFYMGMVI